MSVFRAQDSSRHLTKGLSSVYLPLDWRTPVPAPPIRKHLPKDALAHLMLPLSDGLSRFPLILHAPPPAGSKIPPAQLMARTYHALRRKPQALLLEDWASAAPTPVYYPYPRRLSPHPFMGLDKFVAGRIHQMRAGKRYLSNHPSWFNENPSTMCPHCTSAPESFEHAILSCPAKARERARLLGAVSSLAPDSPLWTDLSLLQALRRYIIATKTWFPPDLTPSPPTSPRPT